MRELAHGHQVGEDLCRVKIICQPVEHRHAGELRQHLGILLAKAAIFDAIVEPAQNSRGVLHGFLVADMAAGWSQISDMRALIVGRHLEPAAGARAVLLENEGDVLALKHLLFISACFRHLEAGGELQQVPDLLRSEIEQLDKTASVQVLWHWMFLKWGRGSADRSCNVTHRARAQALIRGWL